jgi:hypothetical protein
MRRTGEAAMTPSMTLLGTGGAGADTARGATSMLVRVRMRHLADHTLARAVTVGRSATAANVGTVVLSHHRGEPDAPLEAIRPAVACGLTCPVLRGRWTRRLPLPGGIAMLRRTNHCPVQGWLVA